MKKIIKLVLSTGKEIELSEFEYNELELAFHPIYAPGPHPVDFPGKPWTDEGTGKPPYKLTWSSGSVKATKTDGSSTTFVVPNTDDSDSDAKE